MSEIAFIYPIKTRPLSVTGNSCALSCAHCNGHYLRQMKIADYSVKDEQEEIKSYLISGGCDEEGAVPIKDNIELIRELSKDNKVITHTGLINKEDVDAISPYIHAASFNMIGDDSTINEVYNLDKTVSDFSESYSYLMKKIKTYPHITIGLHKGKIKGEYKVIDLLSEIGVEAVVFNVFIPTKDTEFEDAKPPDLMDVFRVISYARRKMKDTKIFLGCMRPGGTYREELDAFCVITGIDRIVQPSKNAKKIARGMGYKITESMECCII
ncbi:MAG: radical SAM protein [Thermoplasmata archaeon]|nr:MAG: radical SAM protein [Thermoplasmata archaeon]